MRSAPSRSFCSPNADFLMTYLITRDSDLYFIRMIWVQRVTCSINNMYILQFSPSAPVNHHPITNKKDFKGNQTTLFHGRQRGSVGDTWANKGIDQNGTSANNWLRIQMLGCMRHIFCYIVCCHRILQWHGSYSSSEKQILSPFLQSWPIKICAPQELFIEVWNYCSARNLLGKI